MSRLQGVGPQATGGFPRVSGDEPRSVKRVIIGVLFSPRERG